ncbi:hypothetical protein CAPTEDRAFT_226238 [Capitella teleta]|uniref:Actin-related protein 10 n=1 Tax=Capitella teleta TaxID=283909 RepID=R7V0Q1_CAPTE|nr:hypothetical protein CAPTEDRAFT_226238 [Capitella teleta]|eukprot:ELU12418.1 hypothetical protein CAPTEDRAFT_226238 [Capitella teleta]
MPLFEGLSYGGEKTAVIFDIGVAFTKCGFAAENAPQFIIPTEVRKRKTGQLVNIHKCCSETPQDLRSVLVDFVHRLYFRQLLVNPKERRVVIVESMLTTTTHFRNTLADVLFKHYEVPSVVFAPGHLVCLFTLGVSTGLIMDVGYTETTVMPVFEGTAILKAWQALPLAGKAIHDLRLWKVMKVEINRSQASWVSYWIHCTNSIDESILEDIKVRCCFVTSHERATMYNANEPLEGPPAVRYPLKGDRVATISGKIRERTCEVLFEEDCEGRSLASLILDAILQSPIDMRRTLAENLVIIGGTSMLPGFNHRLRSELYAHLKQPPYSEKLSLPAFKFHKYPAKANYVAWLGGSMLGALETLASKSVTKEAYTLQPLIPDWCSLYVAEEKEKVVGATKKLEAGSRPLSSKKLSSSLSVDSSPRSSVSSAARAAARSIAGILSSASVDSNSTPKSS